jgi:hypothetical protein
MEIDPLSPIIYPPSSIFDLPSSSVGLRFLDGQRAICYRVKEFN